MKLHITVLASSLALAMPALAKDIPLSQAESIAKSVTPDSASVAFNDLEAQWLTQLRKALQGRRYRRVDSRRPGSDATEFHPGG